MDLRKCANKPPVRSLSILPSVIQTADSDFGFHLRAAANFGGTVRFRVPKKKPNLKGVKERIYSM